MFGSRLLSSRSLRVRFSHVVLFRSPLYRAVPSPSCHEEPMTLQSASRRALLLLVALACLTLAVSPAFAQNITGSLSGTVVDPTGAVVVGADVTLTNDASRDVRRTKSNADGYFAFAAVPPASYTVTIQTAGFSQYE